MKIHRSTCFDVPELMIIHFFIVIGEQKENQQHQLTEYNEIHVSASIKPLFTSQS